MSVQLTEKEETERKDTAELTFTCKICGQRRPISKLREVRRFFPLIIACSECDEKMSYIGKKINRTTESEA